MDVGVLEILEHMDMQSIHTMTGFTIFGTVLSLGAKIQTQKIISIMVQEISICVMNGDVILCVLENGL